MCEGRNLDKLVIFSPPWREGGSLYTASDKVISNDFYTLEKSRLMMVDNHSSLFLL